MKILSLDPGFTTGVAVLIDGDVDLSMAVTRKGIKRNGFLNSLVAMVKPDVVLIEALPQSLVPSEVRNLHSFLLNWFQIAGFDVRVIGPGQWKGMAARVEIPGQHARDAATMASWWARDQGQEVRKWGEHDGSE